MELATTSLPAVDGRHLWVVISDPTIDAEHILIVNLTTEKDYKDRSCVLNRGDHPWITHSTCVDYGRARIVTLKQLYAGKDSGAFKVQEPASSAMVRAIQEGVKRSERLRPDAARELLASQGFIEL